MKRILASLFVVALAFTMIAGCASNPILSAASGMNQTPTVSTDTSPTAPSVSTWQKVKNWFSAEEVKVKAIDWTKALAYWKDFVKYADEAAPLINAEFKNNPETVGKVLSVITDADTAVTTLSNTVTSYKAGTLTEQDVIAAAGATEKAVVKAVNTVANTKGNPTQAAATPLPVK